MTKKARIEELEKKCEELEESRNNLLQHFTTRLREMNKDREGARKGIQQLNDALNSIIIGLALDYEGKIKVKKDHMKLLETYSLRVTDDGENYIIEAIPKEEKDEGDMRDTTEAAEL